MKLIVAFNTTFITLITRTNNPYCFELYKPISLSNYIYIYICVCVCVCIIIAKVIAMRVKRLLFEIISGEQFGFLSSKKIHEVVGVA